MEFPLSHWIAWNAFSSQNVESFLSSKGLDVASSASMLSLSDWLNGEVAAGMRGRISLNNSTISLIFSFDVKP